MPGQPEQECPGWDRIYYVMSDGLTVCKKKKFQPVQKHIYAFDLICPGKFSGSTFLSGVWTLLPGMFSVCMLSSLDTITICLDKDDQTSQKCGNFAIVSAYPHQDIFRMYS
jgi:hypothetical protein